MKLSRPLSLPQARTLHRLEKGPMAERDIHAGTMRALFGEGLVDAAPHCIPDGLVTISDAGRQALADWRARK